MREIVGRLAKIGVIGIGVALVVSASAGAMQFSSTDYTIDTAVLNNVGGYSSSTDYQLTSSGGEAAIGNGASGSYMMPAGYVSQLPSMISVRTEPSGLIGYYPMDEGSGTATYDASANANNGTLVGGPTWTTGKIGDALSFNGTNKTAVNLGNPTQLQSNTITVEAWIKTTDTSAGAAYVSKDDAWWLGNARSNWQYATIHDLKTDTDVCVGTTNITDGGWHQLVMTMQSGVTNGTHLYVDGALQATCTATVVDQSGSATIGAIGAPGSYGYAATATIDQVKMLNTIMGAQQVAAEYSAQNAGTETGLTLQTIVPGASNTSPFTVITQSTAGGYNLAINENHDLQNGSNTVPAISGSIASPIAWSEGTTKGLGFTLTGTNATPIGASWNSGAAYAALPTSATTFYTRTGSQSSKDYVNLQLRADTATTQPSGNYTNTMTVTGTTNP
jgi:hypothetical protein